MADKIYTNPNDIKKSVNHLLKALADILSAGGEPFRKAYGELIKLIETGQVTDPDSLKRCAYNLANSSPEALLKKGKNSLEVKGDSEPTAVEIKDQITWSSEAVELMISVVNDLCSMRPNQYESERRSLTVSVRSERPQAEFCKRLLELIGQIREDLWSEKARAYKQIDEILKNLENTERAFIDSVSGSQAHVGTCEQSFTAELEDGLKEIGTMVDGQPPEFDTLCRQISVKVAHLNNCIERKRKEDQVHLETLAAERKNAEQRLEQSQRDYDQFSRQSHEMLREIENLRTVSLRDPLTGIYNRRAYDSQIVKTLEACAANALRTTSMAVFDIDFFRDFNNTYGHLAGDRVLAYVSRLTREALRSDDFIFRYGGDEFVILMPNVELANAVKVAEKVRRGITSVEFKLFKNSDLTVAVTVSMGVAEFKPGEDEAAFFARADEALYQAKTSGRNRVCSI